MPCPRLRFHWDELHHKTGQTQEEIWDNHFQAQSDGGGPRGKPDSKGFKAEKGVQR